MDEDIILIDDERNAVPVPRFGATVPAGTRIATPRPGVRPSVIIHSAGNRPGWNTPAVAATPVQAVTTAVAPIYAPTPYFPPQAFPQYSQFAPMPFPPYGYPYPPQAGPLSRLGDISPATIVDLAARLLAALSPLPEPPTNSGKESIDIENAVLYQEALAQHAKRDEQLRELGHAIGVLLRGDLRKDAR